MAVTASKTATTLWENALVGADICWCPRQDSNLRTRLRRPMLYPLSYEGVDRRRGNLPASQGRRTGGGSTRDRAGVRGACDGGSNRIATLLCQAPPVS